MESKNPLHGTAQEDVKGDGKQKLPPDGDETQLSQEQMDANSDKAPATAAGQQPGTIEVPSFRADAGTVAAAREEAARTGSPVVAPETRDRGSAPEDRSATAGEATGRTKATAATSTKPDEVADPLEKKDPFKETPGGPTSIARQKSQPGGLGKPDRRRDAQFNQR